jgi:hypothetical protein
MKKWCRTCRKLKSDYTRNKSCPDGYALSCRPCQRAHNAKYYQANIEKIREKNRLQLRDRRQAKRGPQAGAQSKSRFDK